jgi:hypothetical protein
MFLVFLVLFTSFSVVASGIKIWPGEHSITINRWYSEGEEVDHPRIQVTNTESYDINVSVSIDNPHVNTLSEGYSQIPDLSWVKVVPEVLYLPGGSSDFVEVFIEVPESEQSLYYNEKWEALVVFTPPMEPGGGVNVQLELAVKLFIKTPKGEVAEIQPTHILLFFFISLVILYLAYIFIKKKKSSEAIFYFKKEKKRRLR